MGRRGTGTYLSACECDGHRTRQKELDGPSRFQSAWLPAKDTGIPAKVFFLTNSLLLALPGNHLIDREMAGFQYRSCVRVTVPWDASFCVPQLLRGLFRT